MTHKTRGIVIKATNYGETSIIVAVYTELFGLQSYIVKGVRQATKKKPGSQIYFQPSAMLEMEVYHNALKNLQFIKEYKWGYLYEKVLFDVMRTAIAQFMIELFHHAIKQPEANPELFCLLEGSLLEADKGSDAAVANLPLYFILHLATESGFELHGNFSAQTPVLDLKEGAYASAEPFHADYISGFMAEAVSKIRHIQLYNELDNIRLNRQVRRQLLEALLVYLSHHLPDFQKLKSLPILQVMLD
ncbi:DNA repair protein RecO [Parafilimonas sp.]|uniref:DNA repair protein RecO n=1 Tax=Parafilimonas sp. TaxID=1969739 RepID=UPI0039E64425